MDVLVGFEFRDVVKEGGHADDVHVRALAVGDARREVDDVEDVVEPVLRGVPRVPAHPPAVVFVFDARREIIRDEALHVLELGVGDRRLFDFNAHGRTSVGVGTCVFSLHGMRVVPLLGVTTP